jgi:hypothetical protein
MPPIRVGTPGRVYDLTATTDGLVGLAPNAVILFREPPLVLGLGSKAVAVSPTSRWIVAIEPDYTIRAIDGRSGGMFDTNFAAGPSAQIVVSKDTIATLTSTYDRENRGRVMFQRIKLDVPSEPAQLRHWLATVTNATPVPGSETVLWP